METPDESQLEDMILNLKEELSNCNEDTICDELIQEIKFRENQLKELTIKNFTI